MAQDTLVVLSGGNCARGSYVADLHVIRGDRGSRASHIGLAALAGGAVGALAVRLTGNRNPNTGQLNTGKLWAALGVGAVAGGAVGYVLPAGPAWVHAGAPRALRVVGMEVTPGVGGLARATRPALISRAIAASAVFRCGIAAQRFHAEARSVPS